MLRFPLPSDDFVRKKGRIAFPQTNAAVADVDSGRIRGSTPTFVEFALA